MSGSEATVCRTGSEFREPDSGKSVGVHRPDNWRHHSFGGIMPSTTGGESKRSLLPFGDPSPDWQRRPARVI